MPWLPFHTIINGSKGPKAGGSLRLCCPQNSLRNYREVSVHHSRVYLREDIAFNPNHGSLNGKRLSQNFAVMEQPSKHEHVKAESYVKSARNYIGLDEYDSDEDINVARENSPPKSSKRHQTHHPEISSLPAVLQSPDRVSVLVAVLRQLIKSVGLDSISWTEGANELRVTTRTEKAREEQSAKMRFGWYWNNLHGVMNSSHFSTIFSPEDTLMAHSMDSSTGHVLAPAVIEGRGSRSWRRRMPKKDTPKTASGFNTFRLDSRGRLHSEDLESCAIPKSEDQKHATPSGFIKPSESMPNLAGFSIMSREQSRGDYFTPSTGGKRKRDNDEDEDSMGKFPQSRKRLHLQSTPPPLRHDSIPSLRRESPPKPEYFVVGSDGVIHPYYPQDRFSPFFRGFKDEGELSTSYDRR